MRIYLAAYQGDHRLGYLSEARQIKCQIADGGSSLTFDYPRVPDGATGWQGLSWLGQDVEVAVEIPEMAGAILPTGATVNEWGEIAGRMVITADSMSETDTKMQSFTCEDMALFRRLPVLSALGDPLAYGADATPASVIIDRLTRANARGAGVTVEVHDAGGWAADNPAASVAFEDGTDLASWIETLAEDDVSVFMLDTRLFVMPTSLLEVDMSAAVTLRVEDLRDAPKARDRVVYDSVLVQGDDAAASYPALTGRVKVVSASGVSDSSVLAAMAFEQWEKYKGWRESWTAELAMPESPRLVPVRDFFVHSRVGFPSSGVTEVVPVEQITLTADTNVLGADLTLGEVPVSFDVQVARLAKSAAGGVTAVRGNAVTPVSTSRLDGMIPVDQLPNIPASKVTGPVPVSRLEGTPGKRVVPYAVQIVAVTLTITTSNVDQIFTVSLGSGLFNVAPYVFATTSSGGINRIWGGADSPTTATVGLNGSPGDKRIRLIAVQVGPSQAGGEVWGR